MKCGYTTLCPDVFRPYLAPARPQPAATAPPPVIACQRADEWRLHQLGEAHPPDGNIGLRKALMPRAAAWYSGQRIL